MNFKCVDLKINDDPDFGCTIQFSETKDKEYGENQTIEELMTSNEKYFLIQRSYPEDLYENDFYYIETSESDVELSNLDKIIIEFSEDSIDIQWSGDRVEIGLNVEGKVIKLLRKILKKRFKERIILLE